MITTLVGRTPSPHITCIRSFSHRIIEIKTINIKCLAKCPACRKNSSIPGMNENVSKLHGQPGGRGECSGRRRVKGVTEEPRVTFSHFCAGHNYCHPRTCLGPR